MLKNTKQEQNICIFHVYNNKEKVYLYVYKLDEMRVTIFIYEGCQS